jgi:oligopeptidase B
LVGELESLGLQNKDQVAVKQFSANGQYYIICKDKNITVYKNISDKIVHTIKNGDNPIWHHDNDSNFFYLSYDKNQLCSNRVMFYDIISKAKKTILKNHDKQYRLGISKSISQKYLIVKTFNYQESKIDLIDLRTKELNKVPFVPISKGIKYDVNHHEGQFYIYTNDKGGHYRIARCSNVDTAPKDWEDFIPHKTESHLASWQLMQNYTVGLYHTAGVPEKIELKNLQDINVKSLVFNDAIIADIDPTFEIKLEIANFSTNSMNIKYSSLRKPTITYAYDTQYNKLTKLESKSHDIKTNFDPQNYKVEYLWAESIDGTKVPISLLCNKDLKLDGNAPLYLTAYGSYGLPKVANFKPEMCVLADRGFVCAIAHVR